MCRMEDLLYFSLLGQIRPLSLRKLIKWANWKACGYLEKVCNRRMNSSVALWAGANCGTARRPGADWTRDRRTNGLESRSAYEGLCRHKNIVFHLKLHKEPMKAWNKSMAKCVVCIGVVHLPILEPRSSMLLQKNTDLELALSFLSFVKTNWVGLSAISHIFPG